MRERHKVGPVVFDKARGTWRFLQWVDVKRRSQTIGTKREYPTKTPAWRAAIRLPDATVKAEVPTMKTVIDSYREEKMPKRASTRRGYNTWLENHIQPRWGKSPITDAQARPVELWMQSLDLAPKSKLHIRGMLSVLWDHAMWRGDVPTQRNPMELVSVLDASKRMRKPRNLTSKNFRHCLELSALIRVGGRCCYSPLVSGCVSPNCSD